MRPSFVALRQHNFRLWAAANLVSVTGSWMQVLGMNWLVLSATGSPARMGVAVLLQALPVLVLGPFGGALADRLPARPTLVVTQAVYALLALAMAVSSSTGVGGLAAIYAITFLSGVVAALDGPAMGRFGSTVVAPEHLGNALALGSMVNSAGRIVGMSLGGVLVAVLGPAPLFLARAISIAPIIAALFGMRASALVDLVPHKVSENAFKAVRTGFRYVRAEPLVLMAFALAFVLGSLGRNYQVTMGAMVAGPLESGAGGYGALSTAFAVGGVLGGLIAAARRDMSYRFLAGIGLAGSVLQVASGLMPSLWTFGAMMVFIAATAVIIDTVVATRVQLDTRGDMRGRMLALLTVTGSLAGAIGAPLLGWMSETLGARGSLVIAGVVCAAACVGAGLALKRVTGLSPAAAPTPIPQTPIPSPVGQLAAAAAR
ncbi:MFS transporter [Allorhizocola rhizosphaerae]|uniref:MFS transporter n=1 Tax=Allorhizocola rhizosphaerae TaxID=1872709 RepID=UPI000E3E48DD|nr:MFS transporter [Allorhizocola rhizosphaerae]